MDRASLTRNAAIALAGWHPMMLTGSETPDAAERVAVAMTEALPLLLQGQTEKIQQQDLDPWIRRGRSPMTPPCVVARPGDPMVRGKNEPVGLTQMAHHGVLAAVDIHRWTLVPLVELFVATTRGVTRDQHTGLKLRCLCRVVGDWTGCGCPTHTVATRMHVKSHMHRPPNGRRTSATRGKPKRPTGPIPLDVHDGCRAGSPLHRVTATTGQPS